MSGFRWPGSRPVSLPAARQDLYPLQEGVWFHDKVSNDFRDSCFRRNGLDERRPRHVYVRSRPGHEHDEFRGGLDPDGLGLQRRFVLGITLGTQIINVAQITQTSTTVQPSTDTGASARAADRHD